jgi:hypothetical protein
VCTHAERIQPRWRLTPHGCWRRDRRGASPTRRGRPGSGGRTSCESTALSATPRAIRWRAVRNRSPGFDALLMAIRPKLIDAEL